MDEVRAGELHAAPQRIPEATALDERDRHGQPDEGEERQRDDVEPGQDEDPLQDQRQECDQADGESGADVPPVDADGEPDAAGADVRERPDRGPDHRDDGPLEDVRQLGQHECDSRRPESESERRPEAGAVEADRLGDELSDGSRLGRERRRELRPGHAPQASAETRVRRRSSPSRSAIWIGGAPRD